MTVARTPVDSSNVRSIGYDPATQELHVEFHSTPGTVYVYSGVPPEKHAALMAAESKGSALHTTIKKATDAFGKPAHPWRKAEEPKPA